ncbi:MAG: hypothetical protein LBG43_00745 [Treponema sp.]|nr:hypothetical protein [Treponema sp.]
MKIVVVRPYFNEAKGGWKDAEMRVAVKRCVEHDILKAFWAANAANAANAWEVTNILLAEWNRNDAKIAWREECLEEGRGFAGVMRKAAQSGRIPQSRRSRIRLSVGLHSLRTRRAHT